MFASWFVSWWKTWMINLVLNGWVFGFREIFAKIHKNWKKLCWKQQKDFVFCRFWTRNSHLRLPQQKLMMMWACKFLCIFLDCLASKKMLLLMWSWYLACFIEHVSSRMISYATKYEWPLWDWFLAILGMLVHICISLIFLVWLAHSCLVKLAIAVFIYFPRPSWDLS